mmetsp:Transcript_63046/g.70598  ORF Transcript_63046/g.70598 Transcript_63046/m.70598 type:complete len:96 (+) Transcript_63046:33-320(+)
MNLVTFRQIVFNDNNNEKTNHQKLSLDIKNISFAGNRQIKQQQQQQQRYQTTINNKNENIIKMRRKNSLRDIWCQRRPTITATETTTTTAVAVAG